ncbi:MAG: M23 family metallopeptidase [Deltaproteobacteria bacterium]|nr:M23 family metallopeptidase [Deltaproteobacteria bacterium]
MRSSTQKRSTKASSSRWRWATRCARWRSAKYASRAGSAGTERSSFYGKIVILDHGNQYFTVSGHLADLYVEVGQTVDRGDTLATAGDSGSLTGARLYFEVRRGSEPLDPVEWLQSSGR